MTYDVNKSLSVEKRHVEEKRPKFLQHLLEDVQVDS